MRKLKLKTNYNVLLYHFVDHLSQWDIFIHGDTYKFYNNNWNINEEDKKNLLKYKEYRTGLDWEEESNLLEWAYKGFDKKQKYLPLLEIIRYFEKRVDNKGLTLKLFLKSNLSVVVDEKSELEEKFHNLNLSNFMKDFDNLFGNQVKNKKPVSTYLTLSVGIGTQGGANGDGIYSEVNPQIREHTLAIIVHEYFHKTLAPNMYFLNHKDKNLKQFYCQRIKKIYEGDLAAFFNEIVTHSAVETILFKEDYKKRLHKLKALKRKLQREEKMRMNIYEAVIKTTPVLKSYLENKTGVGETRKKLDELFTKYIHLKNGLKLI